MTQQAQIKTTYIDHMGTDLSTVNAARVSYDKKSFGETIEYDIFHDDPDTIKASVAKYKAEGWVVTSDVDAWKIIISRPLVGDARLIKFLAKHKHTSPFNHAFASFHIKAPIYVARQLVKHEYLPWNEVSGRYVVFKGEFYTPEQFRMAAADKKQGSGEDAETKLNAKFTGIFTDGQMSALRDYEYCIKMGMAEEQARARLPLDLMTQWYWSGSLGAFAKMCNLRCKEDTQYESRLVADQVSTIMQDLYPVSWDSLMELEI